MGLRLGIDMDGVVADFNLGWTASYNTSFDAQLTSSMVTSWDSPLALTHFGDMEAFWAWAREVDGHSVFRHLEPYPGAIETLTDLQQQGHDVVVITAKPDWAIPDTLAWLSDHRLPTREIHVTEAKHEVACDVYLDDAPAQVRRIAAARGHEATVCRFVRPWNAPVQGAHDVHDWPDFAATVARLTEVAA